MTRFPLGMTFAAFVAFAILCGLGTWQLNRLAWKRDLVARIAAAQTAEPQPLPIVLERAEHGSQVQFVRVEAVCPGLSRAPFVEVYALRQGAAGSRLVSACRLGASRWKTILVDRGFVSERISARPPVDANAGAPVRVVGVLREPGARNPFAGKRDPAGRFYSREVGPIARALDADRPAPVFLMAETSTNPEWEGLEPAPLPAGLTNRHLEYAITWFGLALALLGVYGAMLLKWRRRARS